MKLTVSRWGLGLAAMSLVALAACSSGTSSSKDDADAGPPQPGGTLTMAMHADLNSLDPAMATGAGAFYIANILYDPLVTLAEDGSLEPGLAESWETPDARTIRFTLRDDVVFHDGTPFNAEAVKFNLERQLEGPHAAQLRAVEEVIVDGEFEVSIRLKAEDAATGPTLIELSRQSGAMASPTAVEEQGDAFGLNPVGTGPFSFVSWTRDQEMVFEKNAEYWQEEGPYVDRLVLRPIPDEATRTNQLRSGELDIIYQVQPKDLLLLDRAEDIEVVKRPSNGWDTLFFNTAAGILQDPDVRRALSISVNRQAIIDDLFQGSGEPGQGPITPSHLGYDADYQPIPAEGDVEEAKELLKKAGVEEGTTIRLGTPNIARFEQMAQLVQQAWRELGIEADLERFETTAGLEQLAAGDYEAIVWYYSGHPDLDGVTSTIFDSEGANNHWVGGYHNPKVDELLRQGRVETDQDERVRYYQEAQDLIVEDAPGVMLRYYEDIYAYRSDVHGVTHRADSILDLRRAWKSQ